MPIKSIPLWVQLALLLMLVFLSVFVAGVFIFELYWEKVLPSLAPDIREVVENIRPAPRLIWENDGFVFRPGVVSLLFGMIFIVVCSLLLARWMVAPLNALEHSVERISSGGQPSQPPRFFGHLVQQIQTLAQRLEQSEEARRLANAAIAHELRTPLSSLRAKIDNLESGIKKPTPEEIAKLHPALDLLEQLVEDLQTLSIDLHLERLPTALLPLLEELCAESPRKTDIRLIVQPVCATVDTKRIRQVVSNLLENAKRYTEAGCAIEVRLESTPREVVLVVADAGAGVEDEVLPKLFTPFYRVEASRSRTYGGSGLGLAVVQKIVAAHGGTVSAHRANLGGLEIRVVLPQPQNPTADE